MNKQAYLNYVKNNAPKSKQLPTLICAFTVGGCICLLGQLINIFYVNVLRITDITIASSYTSMTLIFLGSLFTAVGLYDRLGAIAGGGSIIPITGFANSIVSPAMEYNREGIVLGVMCKMFTIAGPVIVTGIASSIAVGIIYYLVGLL